MARAGSVLLAERRAGGAACSPSLQLPLQHHPHSHSRSPCLGPEPPPGHLPDPSRGSLAAAAAGDTGIVLGRMQCLSVLGAQRLSCLSKKGEGSLQQRGHFPHAVKKPQGLENLRCALGTSGRH